MTEVKPTIESTNQALVDLKDRIKPGEVIYFSNNPKEQIEGALLNLLADMKVAGNENGAIELLQLIPKHFDDRESSRIIKAGIEMLIPEAEARKFEAKAVEEATLEPQEEIFEMAKRAGESAGQWGLAFGATVGTLGAIAGTVVTPGLGTAVGAGGGFVVGGAMGAVTGGAGTLLSYNDFKEMYYQDRLLDAKLEQIRELNIESTANKEGISPVGVNKSDIKPAAVSVSP